jgi:hypothetical protein
VPGLAPDRLDLVPVGDVLHEATISAGRARPGC